MKCTLITGKNDQACHELTRVLAPLGKLIALDRAATDLAKASTTLYILDTRCPDIIVNPTTSPQSVYNLSRARRTGCARDKFTPSYPVHQQSIRRSQLQPSQNHATPGRRMYRIEGGCRPNPHTDFGGFDRGHRRAMDPSRSNRGQAWPFRCLPSGGYRRSQLTRLRAALVEQADKFSFPLTSTPDAVHGIPTEAYSMQVKYPANSRLDCSKLQVALGIMPPTWHKALTMRSPCDGSNDKQN